MRETAVTIIGPALDERLEKHAADMVQQVSGVGVRLVRLKPGYAVDILTGAEHADLTRRLCQKFQNFGACDIFIQSNDAFRKKRLLVADMDATIVVGETLDELAAQMGLRDKVARITERAMAGELDFAAALKERVAMLKGMPVSSLLKVLESVRYAKGAAELVKTMNRFGAKCLLVSGGFDIFTGRVAADLGFWKNIGNRFAIENDVLTGEIIPPIVDKDTKRKTLETEARALNIEPRYTMAVGDGANDIPMIKAAGAGVGYFAKPAVMQATPHQIRHTDLVTLLYMQGYRAEEISA